MFQLTAIPILDDNYLWVIHDHQSAIAFDPGDADPLIDFIAKKGLRLEAILITHHHADHIAGLPRLAKTGVTIMGPEGIEGVTSVIKEGFIQLLGLQIEVHAIPGHTADHLGYYLKPWLFCGDTLFGAGCGRVFDGTIEQLANSLDFIQTLPDETLICCSHEYTLANEQFALSVMPDNAALKLRMESDKKRRSNNLPTVPSTLAQEKETNPFLRLADPHVIQHLKLAQKPCGTPLERLSSLRQMKNIFRGK